MRKKKKDQMITFIKIEKEWFFIEEDKVEHLTGVCMLVGKEGVHVIYMN